MHAEHPSNAVKRPRADDWRPRSRLDPRSPLAEAAHGRRDARRSRGRRRRRGSSPRRRRGRGGRGSGRSDASRRRPRRLRPFVASPWAPVRRCARGHGPPLPDRIPHCDRIRQSDREPDRPRAGRRRGPRVPAQGPARRAVPDRRRRLARCRARSTSWRSASSGRRARVPPSDRSVAPGSGDSVGTVAPSTALAAAAGIAAVAATVSVATVAVARSDRRFGARSALRPSIHVSHGPSTPSSDSARRSGSSLPILDASVPCSSGAPSSGRSTSLRPSSCSRRSRAELGCSSRRRRCSSSARSRSASATSRRCSPPLAGRDRAVRGGVHRTCCEHDWPPRRDGARRRDRSRAEKKRSRSRAVGSPRSRSDSHRRPALQATATPDRKPSPETGQRTRPERASCRIPDRQIFRLT